MRAIPESVRLLFVAAVGILPSCTQDVAPSDPTRRFVVTLGRDTVQLEELTVEPDGSFFGQTVRRVGGTVIDRFEGKVRGDFQIERFESTTRDPLVPEDATPLQHIAFSRVDDSVFVEVTSPEGVYRHAFGSDQVVIPIAAYSSLVNLELALQLTPTHTRREMLFVGPQDPIPVLLDRRDDDVGLVVLPFGEVILVVTGGRIQSVDATGTTMKVRYEPADSGLDLVAAARAYASLDLEGRGLRQLSETDSTSAVIAGAAVSVHYSRPQLRGRVIFGSLVPWGEVWRTGANAATMLTTTADLIIEDNLIPAGTYSVWTIPQPDRWVLILNSQTGQWGTEYDPNQDLVRIPIPIEFTEGSVEAFTISVQQSGSGDGILSFEWDDVRASVTFTPAG